MIPDIGLMIGLYIITRMISFLTRKKERKENDNQYNIAHRCIISATDLYDGIFIFYRGTRDKKADSYHA